MATVYVRKGESIDVALKKFKKKVEKEGIMLEIKRREYYVAPSLKKRLKRERALKARQKAETKTK